MIPCKANDTDKFVSSRIGHTPTAAKPPQAATPKVLKTPDPTTAPIPRSDSVRKVPITFTKSSGVHVAIAMNVAAATSLLIFRSVQMQSTDGRKYISQTRATIRNA